MFYKIKWDTEWAIYEDVEPRKTDYGPNTDLKLVLYEGHWYNFWDKSQLVKWSTGYLQFNTLEDVKVGLL